MAEEEPKKVQSEYPSELPPAPEDPASSHEKPARVTEEPLKDVTEKNSVILPPLPEPNKEKPDDQSKQIVVVEKPPESAEEKSNEGSVNRDTELARVAMEKRMSLIQAWEESEKSKADNKAHKKVSAIEAWENRKKASLEAELKKIEEKLENTKAMNVEKNKNKIALIHKAAEEKKADIEAKRGEDLLKVEESAAKYRVTGASPKKFLTWFSS